MQRAIDDFAYVGTMNDNEYYLFNGKFFIRKQDRRLKSYWVNGESPGLRLLNSTTKLNSKRLLLIQQDHKLNHTPADYALIMQFMNELTGDMFGILKQYYDAMITMQPWNIRPNKRPISDLVLDTIDVRNMRVVSESRDDDYSIYHFAGVYQNDVPISYCLIRSHDPDDEDTWHYDDHIHDYPPLFICDCLALRYQEICGV